MLFSDSSGEGEPSAVAVAVYRLLAITPYVLFPFTDPFTNILLSLPIAGFVLGCWWLARDEGRPTKHFLLTAGLALAPLLF